MDTKVSTLVDSNFFQKEIKLPNDALTQINNLDLLNLSTSSLLSRQWSESIPNILKKNVLRTYISHRAAHESS